ncbi:hypothetical protein PybrP1_001799 [[Pythium] brassicae (nom. inval.)]|nr:hypothetical protein PybrP1_001799 [[Pythium] brassicae (nom. inval.)]
MARGNQRDVDRARAQARQAKASKSGVKGDPAARREADAKALQEKIAKKAAAKETGGSGAAAAPAKKK